MTPDAIPITPAAQSALLRLSAQTGRTPAELLEEAVKVLSQQLGGPVAEIPGVDPADVWEAAADADAGRLVPFEEVLAKRRARP